MYLFLQQTQANLTTGKIRAHVYFHVREQRICVRLIKSTKLSETSVYLLYTCHGSSLCCIHIIKSEDSFIHSVHFNYNYHYQACRFICWAPLLAGTTHIYKTCCFHTTLTKPANSFCGFRLKAWAPNNPCIATVFHLVFISAESTLNNNY